jgi:ABC-type transporter Mla subunit MlaD
VADSNELAGEKENLNNAVSKLKAIISQVQEEDHLLKEDNDSVNRRLEELSRYQEQLLLQ